MRLGGGREGEGRVRLGGGREREGEEEGREKGREKGRRRREQTGRFKDGHNETRVSVRKFTNLIITSQIYRLGLNSTVQLPL